MNVWIGSTVNDSRHAECEVWASREGVELGWTDLMTVNPVQARNLAALLVRAADECERMRAKPDGGMCDFALPGVNELNALLDAVRDTEKYRTDVSRNVVVEAAITFARSKRT